MLGEAKYDKDWLHKLDVYNTFFPGQLIKTYESGVISSDAKKLIEEISK